MSLTIMPGVYPAQEGSIFKLPNVRKLDKRVQKLAVNTFEWVIHQDQPYLLFNGPGKQLIISAGGSGALSFSWNWTSIVLSGTRFGMPISVTLKVGELIPSSHAGVVRLLLAQEISPS